VSFTCWRLMSSSTARSASRLPCTSLRIAFTLPLALLLPHPTVGINAKHGAMQSENRVVGIRPADDGQRTIHRGQADRGRAWRVDGPPGAGGARSRRPPNAAFQVAQ